LNKLVAFAFALATLLSSGDAFAQGILTLSDGRSAVIPSGTGYITLDFKDAAIGARLHHDRKKNAAENCGVPNHQELTANLTFSAQKGKRALFDKGQFTPGVEFEPGYAFFWEDRLTCTTSGDIDAAHGYYALHLGLTTSIVGNDVATFPTGSPATLETQNTKSAGFNTALNRYFGRGRTLGFSVNTGKEWNSPGDDDALQTCVQTNAGLDKDGKAVVSSECKDRFIGPLKDLRTIKTRLDFLAKVRPIAGKDKPHVGIYTSFSTTSQKGLGTVCNFAFGPTLHPKGKPRELLGAFLIEALDFTNANGKHPSAKDRWSARLYAAIPF